MSDELYTALNTFMAFPYLETLDGYEQLARSAGLEVVGRQDCTADFARHVQLYLDALKERHRATLEADYGREMYAEVERGLTLWRDASAAGHVGRGELVGRKPD